VVKAEERPTQPSDIRTTATPVPSPDDDDQRDQD
jgi:hypothetical protein